MEKNKKCTVGKLYKTNTYEVSKLKQAESDKKIFFIKLIPGEDDIFLIFNPLFCLKLNLKPKHRSITHRSFY